MDRISALRNVEEALRAFEAGEADLDSTERRVRAVLRTYATEFEGDEGADLDAYRARGDDPADGTVVVAPSAAEARARVRELVDADGDGDGDGDDAPEFSVDPV
jgi:Tfp pilus assembly protein PilX